MTMLSNATLGDELTRTIKEAQEGNQEAWERLFREYYPKVRRVVRRKLRNNAMRSIFDSTDFASDVMKSLAANLGRMEFPSAEHFGAFLAKVAEQKVIDEHRRRRTLKRDVTRERRLEAGSESESAPAQLASDEPTASQLAQANEAEAFLMDRGSETEKRIIALRREGHDNTDIADRTGWNIRKVQRFLKDLRQSLPGQGR